DTSTPARGWRVSSSAMRTRSACACASAGTVTSKLAAVNIMAHSFEELDMRRSIADDPDHAPGVTQDDRIALSVISAPPARPASTARPTNTAPTRATHGSYTTPGAWS